MSANARTDRRVIGRTPVYAKTYGSASVYGNTAYGSSTTTFTGGQPIIGGSHKQGLTVKMYKNEDVEAQGALSAREQLGPKWKSIVATNKATCL